MNDYPIGTKYTPLGKNQKECEVIDILKTYNHKGELVKTTYKSVHSFMGQLVVNHDVIRTTIDRALFNKDLTIK